MDALNFVMDTYSKEIEKYFGKEKKLTVSFFADSDSLVDEIKKEERNILRYGNFEVKILQDYSIKEKGTESISDFNYCKMDKYKFIKVVTPFTHERAYDFLIGKTDEMEAILKMLKDRESKKNFKFNNDYPVININFDEIEQETIKFLMNEDFREYCRTKFIKLKRGIIFQSPPGCGKCIFRDAKVNVRFNSKEDYDALQEKRKNL